MKRVRTVKIKPAGKVVLFLFILAIMVGGVASLYKLGLIETTPKTTQQSTNDNTNVDNLGALANNESEKKPDSKANNTINISVDEWIGFKSIIDANGGLTTQKDSIFDKLGIKVNVNIINDATQSSSALISGKLDGAGYTVNRYAFLLDKFKSNKVDTVMPYITNYSNGGDGVIAKSNINSVKDFIGKKIGVPRFSEAQTLVAWLIDKSDLSDKDKQSIIDNLILFDSADDTANAFFAGQLDVAATWQPYLSQAQETTGCKLLFSTASATDLILDGVVFRKDFMDANPDTVKKFIQGTLMASELYTTEFTPIKNSMSLFATETNENILAMTQDAALTTWQQNMDLLNDNGQAVQMFKDMSNVWTSLGEVAYADSAAIVMDGSLMAQLKDVFKEDVVVSKVPMFTEEQRVQAQGIDNAEALLQKTVSIQFVANSAVFLDMEEAEKTLQSFVDIANTLNGSIIQIEGNIADTGSGDNESGRNLSKQRAKAVAQYLQAQGIDNSRFVIVGNGISKPIGDNSTTEGKAANRRTDVFFKIVE